MSPQLKTTRILWFAMFMATVAFLVVANMSPRPTEPTTPLLLYVLGMAALADAVVSIVLPAIMLKNGLRGLRLDVREVQDQAAERMFRDLPPTTRVFKDPAAARSSAWAVFMTPFLLGMALSESVALFGLVLLFLGFPWAPVLPFFAVSWGLMLVRFPTERRLFRQLESVYGASLG